MLVWYMEKTKGYASGEGDNDGKHQQVDSSIFCEPLPEGAPDSGFFSQLFFASHLFAPQEITPNKGEKEAADAHQQHVFPAPFNLFVDGVDPDDHDREGQKHEPERHQKRLFDFCEADHFSNPIPLGLAAFD